MNHEDKIENAVDMLVDCALQAPHHKDWAYAQALRILMGDERYSQFISETIQENKKAFEGIAP
jgi:hypothetical protein